VASAAVESMPDFDKIAGVVLAGGRSSRMGRDKAFLEFKRRPLVEHMMNILRSTGLKDVFVSGHVEGYPCITDDAPFSGPAEAIKTVLKKIPGYKGYLFVPVDMPLLKSQTLQVLLQQENGGYFIEWPLPAYLTPPFSPSDSTSVHDYLASQGIYPVSLPQEFEDDMKNINTPQEWEETLKSP
jgi:molybdopterin-guanine dinucleotide biosynthesis protein A